MQKMFTKYMSSVIIVAMLIVAGICWLLLGRTAREHMAQNAQLKIRQISETIENNDQEIAGLQESLGEDYLTRARAFAYIIQKNPDVLSSQEELERIKELLNVDELHVINSEGILFAGTIPKYFGMDFASTKQTSEFLKILEDPDAFLVQDIQPNGAEAKVFQYVGVARQDEPGIVQIGMAPVRLLEAQRKNELSYIFSRMPVDEGSFLFAADPSDGKILASTEEIYNGQGLEVLGVSKEDIGDYTDGRFAAGTKRQYILLEKHQELLLGMGMSETSLYSERGTQMWIIFFCILLVAVITILAINHLLNVRIMDGIHKIMGSLEDITEGRLETVVGVRDNPEFQQLSDGINKMVDSILGTTRKVSRVLDVVGLPIGTFEYTKDMKQVMATEKLRQVMLWSEDEARKLYQDKEIFLKNLNEEMHSAKREGDEIYKISQEPEKWVRIHMAKEENGTFGVVIDVTADMLEKRRIEHERDYDSLTGLCNITKFKRKVSRYLTGMEKEKTAAIVMFDLDHFKEINDQYGHDWGDNYLCACAGFLKELNSGKGLAARRSGDEFCVFFHGWDSRAEVLEIMEQFYKRVGTRPILFPDKSSRYMSISAGLAWYEEQEDETEDIYGKMMKAADEALYEAKRKGRNQYAIMGEARAK